MNQEGIRTRVLYLDDDQANLEVFERQFSEHVDLRTASTPRRAEELLERQEFHVLVVDQRMPDESGLEFVQRISADFPNCAKVILTAYVDRNVMRKAFQTNRIMDFIFKPYEEEDMWEVFRRGRLAYEESLRQSRINQDYENIKQESFGTVAGGEPEIIGGGQGLRPMVEMIRKVARSSADLPVLVRGESGTGKELVARAVHLQSTRKTAPFIAVNCAALSESLWESELFGHEKGAFSNAVKRKLGRFELADHGTLFLDEIGELPERLQVKLLRVLQERVFERVGGTQSISVDVRIIAATNRDLEEEVEQGRFREDLYFRLNVLPIEVPALRDHVQDLPALIDHFLGRANRKTGKNCRLAAQILSPLQAYEWPGNIRELENLVERAVVLSDHEVLNLFDFMVNLKRADPLLVDLPEQEGHGSSFRFALKREEVERYKSILRQTGGNISQAAKILGIHRRTLTDRLRKVSLI